MVSNRLQPLERRLTAARAAAEQLGRGSMAPKLEAATAFVAAGGRRAVIAHLSEGAAALRGDAGTTILGDDA